MSDEFRREAEQKVKEIEKEVAAVDREAAALSEKRRTLETQAAGLRAFLSASAPAQSLSQLSPATVESVLAEGKRIYAQHISNLHRAQSVKAQILDAAMELLRDGEPRHTADLLNHFIAIGIPVGGNDKILTVSAILSKDERFVANRKSGWSLAQHPLLPETGAGTGLINS